MFTTTARAPTPGNEKDRLAGRPFVGFVINGNDDFTATSLQTQFLSARHIPKSRLGLLASLIWESRHV